MEGLIAKTKAKVVAEKQAQAAPDYTAAKVKSRVELIMLQIEQASAHKRSSFTFYRHDEIDELAMKEIAKHFQVEVCTHECYLTNNLIIDSWTVKW